MIRPRHTPWPLNRAILDRALYRSCSRIPPEIRSPPHPLVPVQRFRERHPRNQGYVWLRSLDKHTRRRADSGHLSLRRPGPEASRVWAGFHPRCRQHLPRPQGGPPSLQTAPPIVHQSRHLTTRWSRPGQPGLGFMRYWPWLAGRLISRPLGSAGGHYDSSHEWDSRPKSRRRSSRAP